MEPVKDSSCRNAQEKPAIEFRYGKCSTERETPDLQAEITNLRALLDRLEGMIDVPKEGMCSREECPVQAAPRSRSEQPLMRVDNFSEEIHSLKVALDAKDAELRRIATQLEEKDNCVSAKDATISVRDALLSKAHSRIDELQAQVASLHENSMVNSLREQLEEKEVGCALLRNQLTKCEGLLREKMMQTREHDDKLAERDATIESLHEKNERVSKEIEIVRAECEKRLDANHMKIMELEYEKVSLVGVLEKRIREKDRIIAQKEEMIKKEAETHEQRKGAIQEKDDEMEAMKAVLKSIKRTFASRFKTEEEIRPFFTAAQNGDLQTIKAFIAIGIDMNTRDKNGETALQLAAKKGNLSIVKTLLLAGADLNMQESTNTSALHFASWNNHVDVVRALCNAGAYLDMRTIYGWTELHLASRWGCLEVVETLLDAGARKDLKSDCNQSPVDVICVKNPNAPRATKDALAKLLK